MSDRVFSLLEELNQYYAADKILTADYNQLRWKLLCHLLDNQKLAPFDPAIPAKRIDSGGREFNYIEAEPFLFSAQDELCETRAPFYMAKYPVTRAEFLQFVEDADYDYPEEDIEQMYLLCPEPNCPATHISWLDAKEYCRWLRRTTQEYYSLPNEFEWEKAARSLDGRFYPWGNRPITPEDACFTDDKINWESTVPVSRFAEKNKSLTGCCDMIGNVWEFTVDTFDDPRDPHLLRGGSWCNSADYANCVARTYIHPADKRSDFAGFRLVYLPNDMLVSYRQAYADPDAISAVTLDVVGGIEASDQRMRKKESIVELETALLDAVARAQSEANTAPVEAVLDMGKQAESIHENLIPPALATDSDYLESETNDETTDEPQSSLSIQEQMALEISNASKKYSQSRTKPAKERRKFRRHQQEVNSPELLKTDDGIEDENAAPSITARRKKNRQVEKTTSLTYAAFGLWCSMFASLLGFLIYRITL